MSGPAAISAQLVDMRNVGSYKSLKLTLHVPEEYALKAIEAFGWPTGANPVPVALARLNDSVSQEDAQAVKTESEVVQNRLVNPTQRDNAKPGASPRRAKLFREMTPAQQAGFLCNEPSFSKFLCEAQPDTWAEAKESAARAVRLFCGVESRSEIKPGTTAAALWEMLVSDYRAWMRAPEVVDD